MLTKIINKKTIPLRNNNNNNNKNINSISNCNKSIINNLSGKNNVVNSNSNKNNINNVKKPKRKRRTTIKIIRRRPSPKKKLKIIIKRLLKFNCGFLIFLIITILCLNNDDNGCSTGVLAEGQIQTIDQKLENIFGYCQWSTPTFDECITKALNHLRVFFKTGIPEYNISPFDPHHATFVAVRRGNLDGIGGFNLILRNVSEYGWSESFVTNYSTDYDNNQIVYSQYFPAKSLEGHYEFKGKMVKTNFERMGYWNLSLYDYSQTTTVRRVGYPGGLLKVNVVVNKIGSMNMYIENVLTRGATPLNWISNEIINAMWPFGLPFMKPIINELVSNAFTDIFNESFRYFPLTKFIH